MAEVTLPEGWAVTTLENVAVWGSGGTPSRKESAYYDGNVPWVKTGDLGPRVLYNSSEFISELAVQNSSAKYFPKGSVAIAMYGATIGKTSILGIDATTNQACGVGNPIEGITFSEFLYYFLINEKDNFIAKGKGGAQPNISQALIKEHEIALPPLAEQKVIADKLDTLLAQVDNTKARLERIPEILKRFRQSVLAAAVSGKLTEEWREAQPKLQSVDSIRNEMKVNRLSAWLTEQEKSFAKNSKVFKKEELIKKYSEVTEEFQDEFNLTVISEIPHDWLATNLDNVSIAVTGKTPSTTDDDYWNGNIPFISPTQISSDGKVTNPERFVTDLGAKKIQLLPKGAVMIVCIGTIGKVGLLDTEAAFNQQINALIPTPSVRSKFLFYWAKTLHSWLNKTSSAVVNAAIINKSRLCSAPCPLPSIEEQDEIVRQVEELFAFADRIEHAAQAALSRVSNLTQSILAKAFRGELTADWRAANPELISGEHSAEALLARIKSERAKLKPKKTAK